MTTKPKAKRQVKLKPRQDLKKQEELVSALWDFARTQRYWVHDCTAHPMPYGAEGDIRCRQAVSVNLEGVSQALDRILEIFNYDKIEIQ